MTIEKAQNGSPVILNDGEIEIELGGVKRVLRPNLDAALALSRQAGGLMGVVNRLERMDVELTFMTISLGLGAGPNHKAIPKLVYEAGVNVVSAIAINYVAVLMNGGKTPAAPKQEGDDDLPLDTVTMSQLNNGGQTSLKTHSDAFPGNQEQSSDPLST